MSTDKPHKQRRKGVFGRRTLRITLIIIGILVIIRLILPYVVLHYANRTLATLDGYFGRIDDIDLSIYRGAYQIDDIFIDRVDSSTGNRTRFFRADKIDLSVEWKALLHGSLVGELEFQRPSLIFTKNKSELGDVKKDTNDFRKVLKDFMPLTINRFQIIDGSLAYTDSTSSPLVDVALKDINVLATNLNNSFDSSALLPSSVKADAKAYEGTLTLNMRLNPLAKQTTFDLNAELRNTNLVLLNDFLKAYGKFDVNKGTFGLYTELAAKDGSFKGYVKPVITDLDVVGAEDRKDNLFQKIWESVAGGIGAVFQNQKKDQIATRVPLDGSFKNPRTDTWEAVWEVLKNAFIQALVPSVDHQINIGSVDAEEKEEKKGFFRKIFSSDKDKKKDREKGSDDKKK